MMLVDDILAAAGFEAGVTYRETRFLKDPATTYCTYDIVEARGGSDSAPGIVRRDVTIDLYEYKPDPERVGALEAALDAAYDRMTDGWEKDARMWFEDIQAYQTVYSFNHIDKE